MIVLKADKELNLTFQKLIKMMDAPVEWNGMFFVVGDYLILQGSVRSLFFNFDTKLVVTNIIELKAEEQMIAAVEQHHAPVSAVIDPLHIGAKLLQVRQVGMLGKAVKGRSADQIYRRRGRI